MLNMAQGRPGTWLRHCIAGSEDLPNVISAREIVDAESRFTRFAPLLATLFAGEQGAGWDGLVRSPLISFPAENGALALVKADNDLAPTGSVKARGGMHELLWLVERTGLEQGLITPASDYRVLLGDDATTLFSRQRVVVASTGNLGFSIGRIARAFGMTAEIHMSREAKAWKKEQLLALGADVIVHDGDYSETVAAARAAARAAGSHFVDDERSRLLLAGYACAAAELRDQLMELGVAVGRERPILVYIPCGVGGAPGGITRGLKALFGAGAVCVFVEPVGSACVTAALAAGGTPSVYACGGDNVSIADGLAVPRASELVMAAVGNAIDAAVTVTDAEMIEWVGRVWDCAGIKLEPSAAAAFAAHGRLIEAAATLGRPLPVDAVPVFWCTGGARMPEKEFEELLSLGRGGSPAGNAVTRRLPSGKGNFADQFRPSSRGSS